MRAFLVSVSYSDLLAITIPHNRHHFKSVTIVTSEEDQKEVSILCRTYDCDVVATNLFYDDRADFNKWKALEWALDLKGRYGVICLMDADILWPKEVELYPELGKLYTPRRRIIQTQYIASHGVPNEENWKLFPLFNEKEFAGYSQIFHAEDKVLQETPWHETNWRHAGGADSFFQMKWETNDKIRPDFEVLHIGSPGINWCGRAGELTSGELPEGFEKRRDKLDMYLRGRKGKAITNRHKHEKL